MPNLVAFFTYVVATTFSPGPNNILAMSHASRSGLKATLRFLTGVFVGFLIIMLACCLLNVALVSLLPRIKFFLTLIGAAYMTILAFQIMLTKNTYEDAGSTSLNTFRAGLLVQFMNPKVILYGITVYSLFITPFYPRHIAVVVFAPFLAAVGFVATLVWAGSGQFLRERIRRFGRWYNTAMGLLLVYTAVAGLLSN